MNVPITEQIQDGQLSAIILFSISESELMSIPKHESELVSGFEMIWKVHYLW